MDSSLQHLNNLKINDDLNKINNNEQQSSINNEEQSLSNNEEKFSSQNEQQDSNQNENVIKITLEEAIKMYMKKNKLLIIIGTPCYSAMLHNGYFQSMTELCKFFTLLEIPYKIITIGNESLIPRAKK